MSGIVGIFQRNNAPVDRALLRGLVDLLSYRGPDSTGVWCDGSIGLGHAMLRTTWESSAERQPASVNGRLWITSDVRLDDRAGLISKLRSSGRSVVEVAPDSELILQSYDVWGANCVDHLRGDFSFALWDARGKVLFCARDHFGVRPFYYAEGSDFFLFGNTFNCVRMHPDISEELNEAAIGDFLLFGLNYDNAATAFRDIRRLPPAHCLQVTADGLQMRRYWTPPTDGRIRYKRAGDYIEHFQTVLQAGVADRLRIDRVGILLSGGMDSTSLAVVAKEISEKSGGTPSLRSYTSVYETLIPDREGEPARRVADFLGIPNRRLAMDHLRPFEWREDPDWSFPEPPDNPFFGALFDQFRAVAADCRVVFSGEGNDNLMYFQMSPYVQDLRRHREWQLLLRESLRYLMVRPFPWRGIGYRLQGFFGSDPIAPAFPRWIAPDFARRMNLARRWEEWSKLPIPPIQHPIRPKAHASLELPHWTNMFEHEDAGVTHYPVEVRYPFLDLRIVEYLLALPPFPWFFQKRLLRETMTGRLPESVRVRPKTPFRGDPLLACLRRDGAKRINQLPWSEEMESYINRSLLFELRGNMDAEQVILDTRPHCLNFWLQSVRRHRRTLRVESGNE